jgi:hypothetical protein
MSDMNEIIAEVLRLDELSEVLSPAPWHVSGVDSQHVRDDADDATADAYCSNDATLIAYYRTAAPALAREVQRLQAEIERLRPRPSFCLDCLYDLPDRAECCPECGQRVDNVWARAIRDLEVSHD